MVFPSNFPGAVYFFLSKNIHFPPCHTDLLSWHLFLAPLSTEDIKLSASPVTRARRTALVLHFPWGKMCGCPADWLSPEADEPDPGPDVESASLMGAGVCIRMDPSFPPIPYSSV